MKTKFASPQIVCPELPEFKATDLNSTLRAFERAPVCGLHQSWLVEAEREFTPASVRAGWRGPELLFLAELKDAEIFTFARHANEWLWELGDTFEIFLRPTEQMAYTEFHIAPNNLQLQLRFADAAALQWSRKNNAFGGAVVHETEFASQTWVFPEQCRWYVLARIPVKAVCNQPFVPPGSEWSFSCCRYDYTRGRTTPIVSSTSAHAAPDFHRQAEWGTLRFEADPAGSKSRPPADICRSKNGR
jgi:hypothetical protein